MNYKKLSEFQRKFQTVSALSLARFAHKQETNQNTNNMKKLFIFLLAAVAISLAAGCTKEYDDSALNNRINSLEQRLSALETVMQAYQNNLYIKSVQHTDNMYIITFSDGSTATISNGKDGIDGKDGADGRDGKDGIDGKDGDTLISYIVVGENEVTFVLTDGRKFSIAIYSALSIEFDETDLIVMSPNSTRKIHYTVKSIIQDVEIETVSSADIKAKVVATSKTEGAIEINTGAAIDEYSKVVVLVSNGEKVIMRRLTFEEAGLQVEDNATKNASSEGGEMALEFMSNVECEVVIPEDAKSWISVVPDTRAMERQTITLKLEPNTGHNRSATVTIKSPDGTLNLEYRVEQEGELGVDIDPDAIPDNEIWYVTINDRLIVDYFDFEKKVGHSPFDKNIISHTYTNGLGVIKFDGPVSVINDHAMSAYGNFLGCWKLKNVYLPDGIKDIGELAFGNQQFIEQFRVPDALESVRLNSFSGAKVKEFMGKNTLANGKGILANGILYALSYDEEVEEFIVPETVSELALCLSTNLQGFCTLPNLKKVVIPEGVKRIGDNAFQYCTSLEYVSLPNSLEEVGSYIFRFCPNIKEFVGNSEFITADNKCFLDVIYIEGEKKYGLQSAAIAGLSNDYVIPEGIVTIRPCAFEGCKNLRSVTLPQSLLMLESNSAFRKCPNFEFIYGDYTSKDNKAAILHNYLYCVGPSIVAFAGKGIKEYETPNDAVWVGGEIFAYQNDLEKVVITDDVYYIGSYCFSYSPNLKSITLPKNLKTIQYDPFKGSNNLESVYIRSLYPPQFEDGGIEQTDYAKLSIYVPEQVLQLYLNDAGWAPLRKYIKGYHYTDLPECDAYISTDYSQDGKVTTIRTATEGKGIDIVLMGDAFSDRQIADGTYMKAMQAMADNLFTVEPYKSFKDMFNVYAVSVVSATEGYDYGNTALRGFFGGGTQVGGDDNACFEYTLNAISEERMDEALIVVAMNKDAYAGTCYMYYPSYVNGTYGSGPSVAYFPTSSDAETFTGLIHHEALGHGFPKLADEYAYEDMGTIPGDYAAQTMTQQNDWGWWKNVDFTNDPATIRWNCFLNDSRYGNESLGAYEGGLTYWSGVWRPTENSIMRYNTGGFNAPSREAIYYRIHKLAYGDSWEYNYEDFVKYDEINRKGAAAARAQAYRPSNYKPTHPPVIVNKSWRDAK